MHETDGVSVFRSKGEMFFRRVNMLWTVNAYLRLLSVIFPVLLGGTLLCPGPGESAEQSEIRLLFPFDGLVLTRGYDVSADPGLQVPLVGVAPSGAEVWINGEPAEVIDGDGSDQGVRSDNLNILFEKVGQQLQVDYGIATELVDPVQHTVFHFQLDVTEPVVDVEVIVIDGDEVFLKTAVFYHKADSTRTYSITIDDAVDLFAEIVQNNYSSIFEHPTLEFLRRMHQDYGSVFSFYLFEKGTLYETFDLSQMTDKFRSEWEDNSDWLRLGFHAQKEIPPYPYRNTSYQEALNDFFAVRDQVFRFAGEQTWDRFIRSHYWSGSLESCWAWRDTGIRGFYGAMEERQSYYLSPKANTFVGSCDYWRDNIEDIVFVQTDIWIERDFLAAESQARTSQAVALETLENVLKKPYGSQNLQLFTHESFLLPHAAFWELPERIEESIVWLTDRGYAPRPDAADPFFASLPPTPPYDARIESRTGASVSIAWSHTQRRDSCRYLVYRKDLSAPLGAWVQVGGTVEQRFVDQVETGSYAYRVFAVDEEERQSGGSLPIRFSREEEESRNSDFSGDGIVNLADLMEFAAFWTTGRWPGQEV